MAAGTGRGHRQAPPAGAAGQLSLARARGEATNERKDASEYPMLFFRSAN